MFFFRKIYKGFDRGYFRKVNAFLWIYSCYLTIRYVDDWEIFPTVQFDKFFRIKFYKGRNSKFVVKKRLKCERWVNGFGVTVITLQENAEIEILNDFIIGDGLKIFISQGGKLLLKGKLHESGSGITANSVILVYKYVEVGNDCIIAWDTFITDCDWHSTGGKFRYENTILHDHVWIGVGVKILKGVVVKRNSIVSANSVLVKSDFPESTLIGGIPAKVIKENITNWSR